MERKREKKGVAELDPLEWKQRFSLRQHGSRSDPHPPARTSGHNRSLVLGAAVSYIGYGGGKRKLLQIRGEGSVLLIYGPTGC